MSASVMPSLGKLSDVIYLDPLNISNWTRADGQLAPPFTSFIPPPITSNISGNGTNDTDYEYDESYPPAPLPKPQRIALIFLISLIVFLCIVGNSAAIWVFTRGPRSRGADIRWWLLNLAIADLLMGIFCVPFAFLMIVFDEWIFPTALCPFVLFTQNLSVFVSINTSVAMGVDRFIVVAHPLRSRSWSARSRYTIPILWFLGISFSAVNFKVSRANVRYTDEDGKEYLSCAEDWGNPVAGVIYTFLSLAVTYAGPLLILGVFYSLIAYKMHVRRHSMIPAAMGHAGRSFSRSKRKVVKMLVVVVILFAVCWLPLHAFFLVYYIAPDQLNQIGDSGQVAIYLSALYLAMSNCFLNPVIYGFLNNNFRADLMELIARHLMCERLCADLKQRMMVRALQRRPSSSMYIHNIASRKYTQTSTRTTSLSQDKDSPGSPPGQNGHHHPIRRKKARFFDDDKDKQGLNSVNGYMLQPRLTETALLGDGSVHEPVFDDKVEEEGEGVAEMGRLLNGCEGEEKVANGGNDC